MRVSQHDLEAQLRARGCEKDNPGYSGGTVWKKPNGKSFLVPGPDSDGKYPKELVDDLFTQLGL